MPRENIGKIKERAATDEAYRKEILGIYEMHQHPDTRADVERWLKQLESTPDEYWMMRDALSAGKELQGGQNLIGSLGRGFAEKWHKDFADPVGGWAYGHRPAGRGQGLLGFGKGALLGAVRTGSFGAIDTTPAIQREAGMPTGLMWGQHEDARGWQELPFRIQRQVERQAVDEGWRPGHFFSPPTEWRADPLKVGQAIGATMAMPFQFVGGEASLLGRGLIGAGRAAGGKAVARTLGPRIASRLPGKLAEHLGMATPFVVGESIGGWARGETPKERLTHAAEAYGTWAAFGFAAEVGLPIIGKAWNAGPRRAINYGAVRSQTAGRRMLGWAEKRVEASAEEQLAAADRMMKQELSALPESQRAVPLAEWEAAKRDMLAPALEQTKPIVPKTHGDFQTGGQIRKLRNLDEMSDLELNIEMWKRGLDPKKVANREEMLAALKGTPKPKVDAELPPGGKPATPENPLTSAVERRKGVREAAKEGAGERVVAEPAVETPLKSPVQAATENREQAIQELSDMTGVPNSGKGRNVLERAAGGIPDEQLARPKVDNWGLPAEPPVVAAADDAARERLVQIQKELRGFQKIPGGFGTRARAEADSIDFVLTAGPTKANVEWGETVLEEMRGSLPRAARSKPARLGGGRRRGGIRLGPLQFGKPGKKGTYLGGIKVQYESVQDGVARGIIKGNRAIKKAEQLARSTNALLVSSMESTLRSAPNREAGNELYEAFNNVTLDTGTNAGTAIAIKDSVLRGLGKLGKGRVWDAIAGRLPYSALSRKFERPAYDALRNQLDKVILEASASGAAPIRVLRKVGSLEPTAEKLLDTGVYLDREAYTRILEDGSIEWTHTVKDIRALKEVKLVLADGTKVTVPRDAVALPMQPDYFFQYLKPELLEKADVLKTLPDGTTFTVSEWQIAAQHRGKMQQWLQENQGLTEGEAARVMDAVASSRGSVRALAEFHKHRRVTFPKEWLIESDQAYMRGIAREYHNLAQVRHLGYHRGTEAVRSIGTKADELLAQAFNVDDALAAGWGADRASTAKHVDDLRKWTRSALERSLKNVDETGEATALGLVRGLHAASVLHSVFITNVPQSGNALLYTSEKAFAKGMAGYFRRASREEAARSGATFYQSWREMLGLGESPQFLRNIVGKWYGMDAVEKHLRTVSALAGKYHAEDMAARLLASPADEMVRKELVAMGLKPQAIIKAGKLTAPMRQRAMQTVANKTQFQGRPLDLPILASTPAGRTVFQYKTFVYQHSRMLMDLWRKANPRQKARMLAHLTVTFPIAGHHVARIKDVIAGREAPGRIEDMLMEAHAAVATTGLAGDIIQQAMQYGRAPDIVDPPILGSVRDLSEVAGDVLRRAGQELGVTERLSKGEEDFRWRQTKRKAIRAGGFTGLVGQRLAKELVPYKNIEDESFMRKTADVLHGNVPWKPLVEIARGEIPGRPMDLGSMTGARRSWGRQTNVQRMANLNSMSSRQLLSLLTLLDTESAARIVEGGKTTRPMLKPRQIQEMLDTLGAKELNQLADVMEEIEAFQAKQLQPAAP